MKDKDLQKHSKDKNNEKRKKGWRDVTFIAPEGYEKDIYVDMNDRLDWAKIIACSSMKLVINNDIKPKEEDVVFIIFLRKTALRQVAHRDVARPHFVRSSHLPKSAKKSHSLRTATRLGEEV